VTLQSPESERDEAGCEEEYRHRGNSAAYYSRARSLAVPSVTTRKPPSRSEGGRHASATSSQTATGAPRARRENDSADGRSRIHARGSSGLQRALAERRVRITPAAPEALIRFHPRGKDVALTCTGRYRASLGEGARRCFCCWCGSSVLLSSSVLGKTESTPVGCGGRLGRTSIRTNLSVTVISLGECSPWSSAVSSFVCCR
jgi:hypothetical protein